MPRNLFTSLFSYRPRDGVVPQENYLTEAFAYVLDANVKACRAFAERVIPKGVEATTISGFKVDTQESFDSLVPEGVFDRPDMLITCERPGRDEFVIYSEHKWESGVDSKQIDRYAKQVARHNGSAVLVFIGKRIEQRAEAEDCGAVAMLWEDIHSLLKPLRGEQPVGDFLEFLDCQGLSPHAPLSLTRIAAHSCSVEVPRDCHRIVKGLYERHLDWQSIPEFYRIPYFAEPKPVRWGRVGIEFYRKAWEPQIFVGFLLDPEDHALKFTDVHRGIDLALFIECKPPTTKPKGSAWKERAQALRSHFSGTTIKVQSHEEILQSRWRKFTVQECLADVIRGHPDDELQTQAIYDRLQSWATVLFKNGTLEQAMRETWKDTPDSAAVSA
jgi:hypothetical protein